MKSRRPMFLLPYTHPPLNPYAPTPPTPAPYILYPCTRTLPTPTPHTVSPNLNLKP